VIQEAAAVALLQEKIRRHSIGPVDRDRRYRKARSRPLGSFPLPIEVCIPFGWTDHPRLVEEMLILDGCAGSRCNPADEWRTPFHFTDEGKSIP